MAVSRHARKAATRARLLEAARAVFVSEGFEGATIAAITESAGVAHGTFYVHFESKDALFDELLEAFNRDFAAQLAPLAPRLHDTPLPELVRTVATTLVTHWRTHRPFVAAVVSRLGAGVDLATLRDGLNPPAVALFEAWLQAHPALETSRVSSHLVVQGILAMWTRLGLQALFHEEVRDDEAIDALVHLTLGALHGAAHPTPLEAP